MAITIFWICLTLALFLVFLSEVIQVWRQNKYIKLLSESTGLAQGVADVLAKDQALRSGISALENQIAGFGNDYLITYDSLLDELSDQLAGQSESEALKQLKVDIKKSIKDGSAVISQLDDLAGKKRALHLVLDCFNCKVEASLAKLKTSNAGHVLAEIKNAYDIVNMNSTPLRTSISKSYLTMRLNEARLGAILHELRDRQKEEQRALREEMREEEQANRERERLEREAERDEQLKREALLAAQEAAANASEAERAIHEERIRQLELEVDAAKSKTQKLSMAQMTRVGTVYVISNIGSFGENVLKIGMTRRLNAEDRVSELSSASVPFEFDIHALIPSEDAPKLENELHREFSDRRVNKVNLKKEFFEVSVAEVRETLVKFGIKPKFTMTADAAQFRASQHINSKQKSEFNQPA